MEKYDGDNDSNKFEVIKEIIKHPSNRKNQIKKGIIFLLSAVGFGTIALCTVVFLFPSFCANMLHAERRVEVATQSVQSESSETAEQDTEEASESDKTKIQTDQTQSENNSSDSAILNGTQEAAADYGILSEQALTRIASIGEKSVVQVIGITNEMDYFNQSYESTNQATGLIVASSQSEFYILTESRAIRNAQVLQVRFSNKKVVSANFLKADENTGFSIIKVRKDQIGEVTLNGITLPRIGNSNYLRRGETVVAIGNPMGYSDTIVSGHITSIENEQSAFDAHYQIITTDIQGNESGSGVLLNVRGEIVAIVSQSIGSDDHSILTAYGISQLNLLISRLANNGTRPVLGIEGKDVDQETSESTGIPQGMLVTNIKQDSPAMLAGIKNMDVVVRLGGQQVTSVNSYLSILSTLKEGGKTELVVMRKGADKYEMLTFEVGVGSE